MKKLLILLIWCLCCTSVFAQVNFERTYGGTETDQGFYAAQTADGGYIVLGSTGSFGAGDIDVYLIKTDVNGNTSWIKTIGGIYSEECRSICQTNDSGYVLTGFKESFGPWDYDVYLVRTDSIGDTLWTRTFGGDQWDFGYSVAQTFDNGFIIAGKTGSYGHGGEDVYLIRTDSAGVTLWTRTYGGVYLDCGFSLAITSDSGYIIAGQSSSFGSTDFDYYLIRTDSNGDTLWTRTFGGLDTDNAYSVVQTADGGFACAGYTRSFGIGIADAYLIRTDANGDSLWTRTYGGLDADYGFSICGTNDGGFAIAGTTWRYGGSTAYVYLARINANGDTLWTRIFGGIEGSEGTSVNHANDGGFILTGYTLSYSAGNYDVYFIKTDSNGISNGTLNISTGTFTKNKSMIIFPNPSKGIFTVDMKEINQQNGYGVIRIFNVYGKEIYSSELEDINGSGLQIDLSDCSKGIYYIRIETPNEVVNEKVLVE